MSTLGVKRRRDLARSRWPFLAATLTILIGVMMFASTYDSYLNLKESYLETYDRLALADMTITGGTGDMAPRLASLPGVAAVEVRRQADLPIRIDGRTLEGRFIGMPPDAQPAVNRIDVTDGTYLDPREGHAVVVEAHLARTFSLRSGDQVEVLSPSGTVELHVIGVAASAEYIWVAKSRQEVFVTGDQFGVLFASENLLAALPDSDIVEQTLVLYEPDTDVAATDAEVTSVARESGATDIQTQVDQPSNATLSLDVEGFREMAIAFPFMFLLAAGLTVYVLLTRIVQTQRSTIGTLRASGLTAKTVRRHYVGYGLIVGLVGAVLGSVVGVVLGAMMTSLYTSLLDIPDTVVQIRALTLAIGIAFGPIAGGLAAYLPARAAYRIAPAEAMRGTSATLRGRASLAERLVPPLTRLPVRWRMTMRGIGRARARSISTVAGVVLALVLVLASAGMIDTIVTVVDRETTQISLQDAIVVTDTPVTVESTSAVLAVPNVITAESVANVGASVSANGRSYATSVTGFDPATAMHGWTNPSGSLPDEGMLAGSALRDLLGIDEGQNVAVSFPSLGVTASVKVVEFVDEPIGTPLYMRTDTLVRTLEAAGVPDAVTVVAGPRVTNLYVQTGSEADRTATVDALRGVPGVVLVQDTRTFVDLLNQSLVLLYAFVGIMLMFGGLMAFALMFSTISVNVAERSSEFATLKANGMSDRTIGRLVSSENLLLAAVGLIPGLVLGTIVAAEMMASFSSDMFAFDLIISPLTYVLAAVSMFVVGFLSLIPSIRRIRHIDVGSVMRERSV